MMKSLRDRPILSISLVVLACQGIRLGISNEWDAAIEASPEITHNNRTLHLVGERHSGTNWMTSHLQDCFGSQVTVQPRFSRFKHWFQEDIPNSNAVVLAQFRNPYDWIWAMHEYPHHAARHFGLPWREFVQQTWTMESNESTVDKDTPCQSEYLPHQVIPCLWDPKDQMLVELPNHTYHVRPMYELQNNGSGKPYDNILALRADKIRNMMNMSNFDVDFVGVQYENMVTHGTEQLIRRLEEILGITATCKPIPAGTYRSKDYEPGFVEYLNEHLDWEAEGLAGYGRKSEQLGL